MPDLRFTWLGKLKIKALIIGWIETTRTRMIASFLLRLTYSMAEKLPVNFGSPMDHTKLQSVFGRQEYKT